jgi:HAMP domain-containing protein
VLKVVDFALLAPLDMPCYNILVLFVLLAALSVGASLIVSAFLLINGLRRVVDIKIEAIKSDLTATITDYVSPQGKDPSKLAEITETVGIIIGAAAAKSLMQSMGQRNSAASKVAGEMASAVDGQSNPLLALASSLPKGKGAGIARLAQLLAPMVGGNHGNQSSGGDVKFTRLER